MRLAQDSRGHCHPGVTPGVEKWSGRLDSNQRPPAPKAGGRLQSHSREPVPYTIRSPISVSGRKMCLMRAKRFLFSAAALLTLPLLLASTTPQQQQQSLLLNPDGPEFNAQAPEKAIVRLDSSKGAIDIEVIRKWAPLGADRFVALARHGYYDGTRFFRVRPGRWVQFGVNGDPAIAKAWRNKTIQDDAFVESNKRGTVAFAFAVPNGRTTQVFVNTGDNAATHDKEPFTPFGRVISGMEHVDAINAEYGEGPGGIRAGKQDAFFEGGNAWLLREFPRLDFIRRASVIESRR
jgi:peptidyl-prolyl cis-trans isomerase A (cyclophilin A)